MLPKSPRTCWSGFTPTPKASPAEQAERALRRPKQLIYCALSNRHFFWRQHITKFVLDEGHVPIVPFMLFDYYLLHTVPKEVVREACNNLIVRSDQMWVFGHMSLGVKVQIGIAKRLRSQCASTTSRTCHTAWSTCRKRCCARSEGHAAMVVIWVVVAIVALALLYVAYRFNRLIRLRQRTQEAWADIDVELKRRHDLIPNLVSTVQGYAAHELRCSRT